MIKTVIFDIDDTMYDYTGGNRRGLEAVRVYCLTHLNITGETFLQAMDWARNGMEERLGKAGCRAKECLFIGDSQRGDVQGPVEMGMHASWYRPLEGLHEDRSGTYQPIQSFEDCMGEAFWKNFKEE